jgi:hypothetical protein
MEVISGLTLSSHKDGRSSLSEILAARGSITRATINLPKATNRELADGRVLGYRSDEEWEERAW